MQDVTEHIQVGQFVSGPSLHTPNYTTGLAHIILAATSGWAIHATTYKREPFAFGCFVYLMVHSLLGVLCHTHPNVSVYIKKLYKQSFIFAQTLPLPLINIQLQLNYRRSLEYIYGIALSASIPTILDLVMPTSTSTYVSDVIQLANIASFTYLGATFNKCWMLGMAFLAGINYFAFKIVAEKFHVPKVDLHTVGLAFLVIFAVNSINE